MKKIVVIILFLVALEARGQMDLVLVYDNEFGKTYIDTTTFVDYGEGFMPQVKTVRTEDNIEYFDWEDLQDFLEINLKLESFYKYEEPIKQYFDRWVERNKKKQ